MFKRYINILMLTIITLLSLFSANGNVICIADCGKISFDHLNHDSNTENNSECCSCCSHAESAEDRTENFGNKHDSHSCMDLVLDHNLKVSSSSTNNIFHVFIDITIFQFCLPFIQMSDCLQKKLSQDSPPFSSPHLTNSVILIV